MSCICDWEDGCGGVGVVHCRGCGGDLCVCRCGGSVECDGCPECADAYEGADDCDDGPYDPTRAGGLYEPLA